MLLFWGRFCCKTIIPDCRGAPFLPLQDANPTPSFGGFGLTPDTGQVDTLLSIW